MKKSLRLVAFLLVTVMIIPLLAACRPEDTLEMLSDKNRAVKILQLLDERIQEADSFTVHNETHIDTIIADGSTLSVTSTTDQVIHGRSGESPARIADNVIEYQSSNYLLNYTVTLSEGYIDGQMFRYVRMPGFESRLYSDITPEQISEYDRELYEDSVFSTEDMTSSRAPDGSWVVTIRNIGGEIADRLSYEFASLLIGYSITSVEVIITAAEDLSSWTSEVVYQYGQVDDFEFPDGVFYSPVMSNITSFSGFGSTEAENPDLVGYTRCDDLSILNSVSNALNDKILLESAKAVVDIKQNVLYRGQKATAAEYDVIRYGNGDAGFHYEITSIVEGITYRINYADGIKTQQGKIYEAVSYDGYERSAIQNLFTCGLFNPLYVESVTKLDENKYSLDVYMTSDVANSLSVGDRKFTQGSITVTVTFENGELSAIDITAKAYALGVSGGAENEVKVKTRFTTE